VGGPSGNLIPYCPTELFATSTSSTGVTTPKWQLAFSYDPIAGQNVYTDANDWAIRGAINAGLAVFLYVDQLSKGIITPKPPYSQCELINSQSNH